MLLRLWLVMVPKLNCYAYKSSLFTSSRLVLHSMMMNHHDHDHVYQGKTIVQLKEMLRLRGLPVSGLKKDLISRLSIVPISSTTGTATNNATLTNRIPIAPLIMSTTSKSTSVSPTTTSNTSQTTTSTSPTTKPYLLQFDGGSRGNPGHAGSGSVILDGVTGREVWHSYTYVGPNYTNNVAEYRGLIEGLRQVSNCLSLCVHTNSM